MNTVADSISVFNRSKPDSLKLQSTPKSSPVSRAITFGSPLCRDKVHKLVREQMDAIRAFDRAKWGFDFHAERPTSDSKYEWKKSATDSRAADHHNYAFYAYKHPSSSFK